MYTEWTEAVRARFLQKLADTGNVAHAARLAEVSRSHAYKVRAFDRDFARSWQDAEREATFRIRYEARRRALETLEEPMIHRGAQVRGEDGSPILVRRYNDRMLVYLLRRIERRRGAATRYREKESRARRDAVDKAMCAYDGQIWCDDDDRDDT